MTREWVCAITPRERSTGILEGILYRAKVRGFFLQDVAPDVPVYNSRE